ncbi:hypothetical protein AB0M05_40890 [Streptomyces violaceusniger]|uniref:hypothetical protein n=1 Tax=Streptomyces violaceusniger TaxID=68280 RepID=UPI0034342AED
MTDTAKPRPVTIETGIGTHLANTAPAQVGNGNAVHYVRKDAFHTHTIGCNRRVSRELTDQQAAGRKECGACKRAVEALVAEQSAEQAPAVDQTPATPEWRTLKGVGAKGAFQIYGELRECNGERVFTSWGTRDQVKGEAHTFTRQWTERGHRYLEDTEGCTVEFSGGAATKVWVVDSVPAPAAAPAEEESAAPAEDTQAAKVADIERRVRPLDADTIMAATMFDPELTYYADGTPVVMRAKDTERTGTTFGMADGAAYAYQAVRWDDGGADLVAPHVLHRAEAHRQELVTEVVARFLVLSSHITAHAFQPVDQPDGERIAWTFRTGHGARARYHWASTRNVISLGDGSEYRWQAERAARLARRTGLDEAPMPEHIALVTAEPDETLERMVAALDQDTVYVEEDGAGRWVVKRGGTFLGTVHDEGARMRRGRYAAWAPYAERRDGIVGFFRDMDDARDAVVKAWPMELAEIAGELGVPVAQVLEVAEQVEQEWKAEGRRAVLRAEAYIGTDSRVTQAAAAEVRQRLELAG